VKIKYKFNESGMIKEVEIDVSDKVALALSDLVREEGKLMTKKELSQLYYLNREIEEQQRQLAELGNH